MSKIENRYASAVRSSNMRSKPGTEMSDSDVIGAAGLAARRNELAISLMRLFSGDNREAHHVVRVLSEMAWGKAKAEHVKLKRAQADDMARAVLAWFRDGRCDVCRGHGYKVVGGKLGEGRAVLSDAACSACKGTRKLPFDTQFAIERRLIARWLLSEVERQLAVAGAEAMKALGARMDV